MTILRYLSVTIPLFVALLFSPPWVAASEASPDDQTPADLISAEVIRSDLTALYNSLAAAHANLYAHRPKAQYDEEFGCHFSSQHCGGCAFIGKRFLGEVLRGRKAGGRRS